MQKKILAASVAAALAFALPALAQTTIGGGADVKAGAGVNVGGADVKAGVNTGAEAGIVTEGRPTAGNASESAEGKAGVEGKAGMQGQARTQPRDLTPEEKKRVPGRSAKRKSNGESEGKRQN